MSANSETSGKGGRVDVLAVLDMAIAVVSGESLSAGERGEEARDAVVEFIQATKDMRQCYISALRTNCRCDDDFINAQTKWVDDILARIGDAE